ncbi:MAG: peptidoglycan-binding domain-containing protein [Bryobacteraceae bacterium]|nr:peptidoglycan-binding domain-containing protein [Bryobacteraceae bacterium]
MLITNKNRWPALFALLLTYVIAAFAAAPATTKKKAAPTRKSTATASKKAPVSTKKGSASARKGSASARKGKGRASTSAANRRRTPAPPPRQASPSRERYTEIQQALSTKGYSAAPADGVWGPGWVDALRRFQSDQNLQVDGKLGALSLIALGLGPKRTALQLPPPPSQQFLAKPGETAGSQQP